MPAEGKYLENTSKHWTKAELEARAAGESAMAPVRAFTAKLPRILSGDKAAASYWRAITKKMGGLGILDDLDADVLSVYCSALSRRDAIDATCRDMLQRIAEVDNLEVRLEMFKSIDQVMGKLQKSEGVILQYADKLGLTPDSRNRLSRRAAVQAALAAEQPVDSMFGD
ncbi:MAG: P27 family phage terminase small subunit [Oscillospiraceae bacterium]|nr:P27 family phage terminase small subunit [Oscillospiraceae bacterium]